MKKLYIAGLLTNGDVEHNIDYAIAWGAVYTREGYAVYIPHIQTHEVDKHYNKDQAISYNDWLSKDIAWLEASDIVVFIPGWEGSKGATIEHTVAQGLDKIIIYPKGDPYEILYRQSSESC